ncbi:hypothetical protein QBC43DRAFT_316945 [Cladorrhinum sp. PSN259]|nr:hypothetical protein QBC43DRAFT_316945 [Cladorrhinum sp. PSN259]
MFRFFLFRFGRWSSSQVPVLTVLHLRGLCSSHDIQAFRLVSRSLIQRPDSFLFFPFPPIDSHTGKKRTRRIEHV